MRDNRRFLHISLDAARLETLQKSLWGISKFIILEFFII